MVKYSGCDTHKEYSIFVEIDEEGELFGPRRVHHGNGELRAHLEELPDGTPVAFETGGNWYWLADAIEEAGCVPRLVHARRAEARMGHTNKTDSLDAEGLVILQTTGTLPEAWIPPAEIRDQREALRFRMKLSQSVTRWKNRTRGLLRQYRLEVTGSRGPFTRTGRSELEDRLEELPEQTRDSLCHQLDLVDHLEEAVQRWDERIEAMLSPAPERDWLQSMPGVGPVLSAVILLEVGDVARFPGPGHLASYAGTTPRVHQSGDAHRTGSLRKDANQTLKWAFFEAANVVVRHQSSWEDSRLVKKYRRLKKRKNSGVAKGAVARMLAESTYWVLTNQEPYREPD